MKNDKKQAEATIYIQVNQDALVHEPEITVGDLAEVYCSEQDLVSKVKAMPLLFMKPDKPGKKVISVLRIIREIETYYPDCDVVALGEPDVIVEYQRQKSENFLLQYVKLLFVSAVVFCGSAFTIMTFNTDVSVGEVFDLIYQLVMNKPKQGGSILELTYCIGIPLGILGFYNHYCVKKAKSDPTPIHIEMRNYEQEMNQAIIQDAARDGREL